MADRDTASSPVGSDQSIALTSAAPDWASHREEVLCPLCGYNLRGLADARCPECGYAFDWADLLDVKNHTHPYLFEHYPKRNIWSFCKTVMGGWRPRRFWKLLKPVHTVRPGRLILTWVLVTVIGVLMFTAASFYPLIMDLIDRRVSNNFPNLSVQVAQEVIQFWARITAPAVAFFLIPLVIWPWITFLTLMIFRISMRKAGVRAIHVLRAVLYSGNLILPVILIYLAVLLGVELSDQIPTTLHVFSQSGRPIVFGWVAMTYSLYIAYRRYLHFDHPLATVLASQIIAALSVPAVAALIWECTWLFDG